MNKETFKMNMLAESNRYLGEYDEYEDDLTGGEKQDYTIEDKYDYILGLMNNIPSDQLKELAGMICGETFDPDEDDRVVFSKCAASLPSRVTKLKVERLMGKMCDGVGMEDKCRSNDSKT